MPTPTQAALDVHVASTRPTGSRTPRTRSRRFKVAALAVIAMAVTIVLPPGTSMAATAPTLGAAESFAVLGASTVTNTGPSVINGNLGLYAGTDITGFDVPGGPGIVNGVVHNSNATAQSAQADALTAYNALAAQGCDFTLASAELGNRVLTPGTYCVTSTAQLTGALTLDAQGDPEAVFIFRVPTALNTASNSSVIFLNNFSTCNVFWQVGSAASIGTNTNFVGTVIALTEAITVNTGATITGRLMSLGAAVTLDTNVITTPVCTLASPDDETTTTTTPGVADTTTGTAAPPVGGPGVTGLPATGSSLMPMIFAMVGIVVGSFVVMMTNNARKTSTSTPKR